MAFSHRGTAKPAQLSRLVRTLIWLLQPTEACEITFNALRRLAERYGADSVRWRTNISDDIRVEIVAPGLLTLGIPAYCYTKYTPLNRPQTESLRYSVTERWGDGEISAALRDGHTLAVVFAVK